jgi:hypothetical protein
MHSRARMAPGHDMFNKTTRILRDGVHSTQFVAYDKGLIVLCSWSCQGYYNGGVRFERFQTLKHETRVCQVSV